MSANRLLLSLLNCQRFREEVGDDEEKCNMSADGRVPEELSMQTASQRSPVAQADASAVKIDTRPSALQGVRIPSRNENARQLVFRIYEENPHLQRADLWAVTRYAELSWKFRRLAERMERMEDGGLVRSDGEPRKLLAELRSLSDTLLRHERDLGITVTSRASLGLDVARMRRLAPDGAERMPEADVEALEQRIVARLQGERT